MKNLMNKDYNTQRDPLVHKEYGRNIKNLASFVQNIEDQETRTKYAHTLVKLMKADHTQSRSY